MLTDHLLTLVGLTPEPKVTRRGDDPLSMQIYHHTKFQHDRANGLRDMSYQSFSLFGPWGANAWAKVHQKGRRPGGHRGLPSSKVSPPYVHPCRRYPLQKSCGQRNKQTNKKTNKQTVNDISTTCLSACVDNNTLHIFSVRKCRIK